MSLTLWDHPDSSNALKVRFLLAELGLDYERRTVPMTRPRPDEYLAVNPLSGIPTLDDGDLRVSESHAILRYLATREGRDDLYPSDARERAKVDEWLERFNTRLRTPFFRVEMVALGWSLAAGFEPDKGDLEKAKEVVPQIAADVQLLDDLSGADFAVLGRFTIADCALAPILHRTTLTGHDLSAYPNLLALRASILARPAWAAAEPAL